MKSNWSALDDALLYSGMGFVGYIVPKSNNRDTSYNGIPPLEYDAYISEGGIGRETPITVFTKLNDAVDFIEKFFENTYSSQKDIFEKLLELKND